MVRDDASNDVGGKEGESSNFARSSRNTGEKKIRSIGNGCIVVCPKGVAGGWRLQEVLRRSQFQPNREMEPNFFHVYSLFKLPSL